MYRFSLALTGLLASTSLAVPTYPSPHCRSFTDNFEDINGAAIGRGTISVYNGVTYQAFEGAVKSPVTGATGGVTPHSGNGDIVVGVGNDAIQLGSVTVNPFGNILAAPSKAFDLYSFWFGCGSNFEQPLASTAVGCVLAVTGYTLDGYEVPVATFSYAPTNPAASPMNLAVLPLTYRGLQNVTLAVASSSVASTITALWLDDVTHCNYT